MLKISKKKEEKLLHLSNDDKIITALAIDQRGSLKKMIGSEVDEVLEEFKVLVSQELTPYASSILLDPEYGLPASKVRDKDCGLILAYEETGYDASSEERYPDLLDNWSALRIKEEGADAVKILLYYDIDADPVINDIKHAFVERVGSECEAEDIPYFLEIVTYDTKIQDTKSREYAEVKAHKVNDAMALFSDERYKVDVLKVEVPVNMSFVEGYGDEVLYTKEEAMALFKEQSGKTHLPFIFLSAGVSAELFQETIKLAGEAGSSFNGVLCGRATWKDSTAIFAEESEGDHSKTAEWLKDQGKANIDALNEVIAATAQSWADKVEVI
ncbi:tagatose-bisphosphate aldolase [Dolosicoccus paucivorans]